MAVPMRFTTFRSIHDKVPHPYDGWDSFSQLFKLQVAKDKYAIPLYCPAEFAENRRLDRNVLHINFGVIDVDDFGEDAVLDALNYLTEDLNLQVLFHTTHSHAAALPDKFKCRIIIPFSRPAEVDEWDRIWHGMNELVGGIADVQCKNPNRIYFFPSCPPGSEEFATTERLNPSGDVLDVDELLGHVSEVPSKDSYIEPIDPEKLARITADVRYQLAQTFLEQKFPTTKKGKRNSTAYRVAMTCGDFGLDMVASWPLVQDWNAYCEPPLDEDELQRTHASACAEDNTRRLPFGWRLFDQAQGDAVAEKHIKERAKKLAKKDGQAGILGRRLEKMIQGDPIGTEAEHAFGSVAELLGRIYDKAEPVQLALLVKQSIEATQIAGNRDITVDWVAQQIRTTQETLQTKRTEEQVDLQVWERNKIRDAFRTIGIRNRATIYTKEELQQFAAEADLDALSEFKSRWIVQYGKRYYFFIGGEYTRSHDEREAFNQAKDILMLARLPVSRETQNGRVNFKMHELIERYGSIASAVDAHLVAKHSYYNGETKTLVEAPRHPLRDLTPEYDERVHLWLRAITDDDVVYNKLLDWLATLPFIAKPTSCLFLHGEPRTGKTLIANGCTRLWLQPDQGGPTQLEDVTGNFNSMLFDHCPLVFGDEFIPSDYKGEPRTDLLRRLIQEHARTLRRKNIHDATLVGAIRLVIAANDPSIIVNERKALTDNDISAINERFLCVPIKAAEARVYLDKLSHAGNSDFFSGDVIPKHIWWLNKNRKVKHGPRLLVEGLEGSELEMRMMTGAGLRSEICHWIANYILAKEDKRNMTVMESRPIIDTGRDGETRLLVTAKTLYILWDSFVDSDKPPIAAVEKALGGVCATKRVKKGSDGSKYRRVNLLRVKHWAVLSGVCSEEQFDNALTTLGLSCALLDTTHTSDD